MFRNNYDLLRRYVQVVAAENNICFEEEFDPITATMKVIFYELDKKVYGIHFRFELTSMNDVLAAAVSMSNNVYSRFHDRITYPRTPRYEPPRSASRRIPKIDKVIFNDPATIVMWADGTKTVVKAVDEGFDPEKGLAMAITKKALGNEGNYYNTIKKYIDEYQDVECLYPCLNVHIAAEESAKAMAKIKDALNSTFGAPKKPLRGTDA